jgi:hypothetical protein
MDAEPSGLPSRTTKGGSIMRNRVAEFVLKIPGDPFGAIEMAVRERNLSYLRH